MKSPVSKSRRVTTAAATAAVALLAAACGASVEATDTAEAASGGSDAPASNLPVIDASLFSGEAMLVEGGTFDLGTLADKDLVLWFWAPW